MADERYAILDTALGTIGLAWSTVGLTRLQLPERDRAGTEARLRPRGTAAGKDEPPGFVAALAAELEAYARGEPVGFASVPLDLAGARAFDLPVWRACRALAWGTAVTYGELTRGLGAPYVATAVGQALGRNPVPLVVPCHRVVAAGHKLGGFSAPGGAVTKERLLALEGVRVEAPPPPLLALMGGPR